MTPQSKLAAEMAEGVRQGLALVDAADATCPINSSRRVRINTCPKCGATAIFAFVAWFRNRSLIAASEEKG